MIFHGLKDDGAEMLWQAESGFSFRMPQGHTGPEPATFAHDAVWQNLRDGQPFGVTSGQLRTWFLDHGVGAIVVEVDIARRWRSLMTDVTGSDPHEVGGVVLYTIRQAPP